MSTVVGDGTRPSGRWTRSTWALPFTLFLVTFCAYLSTAAYAGVSGDVLTTNLASWQIARGTPYLDQISFRPLQEHPARDIWVVALDNGREVIGRSPGAIVAGVPAYWIAGLGTFSLVPGAVSAALLTAIAVALLATAFQRLLPRREAALGAAVFGLTTPVWSVAANGMWPHTITVLGVCGMAWASTSRSRHRWWWAGLFGGLVLWGRLHAAVLVAVFGLFLAWRHRSPRLCFEIGLPSLGLLALQACWTRWLYDSWDPTSAYDSDSFALNAGTRHFDLINQLGFWISPDRGFLVWTPLALVLLPSLIRSWSALPDWTRGLVWAGLAYTLLQGSLNRFSGGDTLYGYRLMLEFLACAAPAMALSAPRMGGNARLLFAPVLALQAVATMAGAANNDLGLPSDDAWSDNSFVHALGGQVWLAVAVLCVAGLMGWLGQRIWRDLPATRDSTVAQP